MTEGIATLLFSLAMLFYLYPKPEQDFKTKDPRDPKTKSKERGEDFFSLILFCLGAAGVGIGLAQIFGH
jgi:hypothetical protein